MFGDTSTGAESGTQREHRSNLDSLADALLEHETLDEEDA